MSSLILDSFEVHNFRTFRQGAFETLRKKLFGQIKDPELERVGIMVDADDPTNPSVNIRNRWESIKGVESGRHARAQSL